MTYRRQGDWITAMAGTDLVMLNVEKGTYIGLTEVGAHIWEMLAEPMEFDRLCEKLVDEFAVTPEVCRSEVATFLNDLVKQGVVTTA